MTKFARHLAAALDPVAFARQCGFTLDSFQETLLCEMMNDWIVLVGRQGGKTLCAAIAGLWLCQFIPQSLVTIFSVGQRQAQELLGVAMQVYRQFGSPVVTIGENASSATFENGSRMISLPSQSPGTVRGYTPNLIIVDEAAQCSDELYQAIRPMQLVSGAHMWLLSTPYGKRGFFYEQWTEGGERWRRIKVTSEDNPRIDREFLEAERATSLFFASEYMCEFTETSAERVFSDAEIDALFPTPEVEPWNVV